MRPILCTAALSLFASAAAFAQPRPPGAPPSWDANADQVVSREEFDAANAELFAVMDHDGDGRISEQELPPRPSGPPGPDADFPRPTAT